MISLLLLMLFMLVMFWMAGAASRRQRRRREEAMRQEMERRRREGGDEAGPSPFDMMLIGGLLEHMIGGAGSWGRSYTYDEQAGQWVEVTADQTEPSKEE